jgi:hypothetical protein
MNGIAAMSVAGAGPHSRMSQRRPRGVFPVTTPWTRAAESRFGARRANRYAPRYIRDFMVLGDALSRTLLPRQGSSAH